MDRNEYEALKNKARDEYRKRVKAARHQLRSELRKSLEAIDTVYRMAKDPAVKANAVKREKPLSETQVDQDFRAAEDSLSTAQRLVEVWHENSKKYGELAKQLRNWIMHQPGNFSPDVVFEHMKTVMPDVHAASISGTLARMARKKQLICVEKGVGKRPAIYHRLEGDNTKNGTTKN